MNDREFEKILASAEQLRLRLFLAEPWTDRYSDMNSMKKSMLLDELFVLRKADKEERDRFLEKLDRKNLYGSKKQKISHKKKEEAPSHEENKDDFDGTSRPSSVRRRVSARTCCSLLAAAWQMYQRLIIRYSQHTE